MRFWKATVALFVLFLLASGGAGALLCEMALHPGRKPLSNVAQSAASQLAQQYQVPLKNVELRLRDGVVCRGWYFRNLGTRHLGAVLVLHGLSDNRSGMLGYIELLVANGYSVLAPDSRLHGESDGAIATYGLLERGDVVNWLQWLHQEEPSAPVFALGESMGAAILLQSLEAGAPVRAAVAEACFSNFREIGCDRVSQKLHVPLSVGRIVFLPAVEAGFLRARYKYNIDLSLVSPEQACRFSHVPILLIHSRQDTNIPFRHALRIQEACGARIQFWDVPDGGHAATLGKHRAEFTQRVLQFFEQYR